MWPEADRPELTFLIGLDLAQGGADYTAIAVIEKRAFRSGEHAGELARYAISHLDRWRSAKTTIIPQKVAHLVDHIRQRRVRWDLDTTGASRAVPPTISLIVDQTGVGPFGLDPLREAGFRPIGIQLHGGYDVSHPQSDLYRVPKRDVINAVVSVYGGDRLSIDGRLALTRTLTAEVQNIKPKISLAGHDSYAAGPGQEWREGSHDDLVLAAALALWFGEAQKAPRLDPLIARAFHGLPNRRR
jgi:hypothetical protein